MEDNWRERAENEVLQRFLILKSEEIGSNSTIRKADKRILAAELRQVIYIVNIQGKKFYSFKNTK